MQPIFERICQRETLLQAWRKVRANGGAPGGDGQERASFERDLSTRVDRLARELRQGKYRPGPLRKVVLNRTGGKPRCLRIPSIRDRVVQTACQALMAERLDRRLCQDSFAYRPARSVPMALARLRQVAPRRAWVLDADIEAFFDRVSHAHLLDDLGIWLDEARLMRLVALWLTGFGRGKGLAQGAPISPILANLYLHPLDQGFARRGIALVRYADDFVALAGSKGAARKARGLAERILSRRALVLSQKKTRLVPPGTTFCFLGETIRLE